MGGRLGAGREGLEEDVAARRDGARRGALEGEGEGAGRGGGGALAGGVGGIRKVGGGQRRGLGAAQCEKGRRVEAEGDVGGVFSLAVPQLDEGGEGGGGGRVNGAAGPAG